MNVNKEIFSALADLTLRTMVGERISKVANKHSELTRLKALTLVTYEDVKAVSAFDSDLEALASTILGLMPSLKEEMPTLHSSVKAERIKWAQPKTTTKADF